MKWKSILCIVLSLAAVCSLALIRDSAAWFDMRTGTPLSQTITARKMYFEFEGKIASYMHYEDTTSDFFITTDQNLITDNEGKITGWNRSTIDTEVRFRIVYASPNSNAANHEVIYAGGSTEELVADIDSNWTYDSTDGYYHRSFTYDSTVGDVYFTVINSIMYSDDYVTRADYLPESNGTMTPFEGTVRVEFEARQTGHNAPWSRLTPASP